MNEQHARRAGVEDTIPGEAGVWAFVLGDMSVFSVLFCVYLYYRDQQAVMYRDAQATLNPVLGLFDTVVLLSSSWCVALAVHALRQGSAARARRLLLCGLFCGAAFIGSKLLEYADKLSAGITPTTNEFFSFYYVLTGLHFAHTVIGMLVLIFMIVSCRRRDAKALPAIESGATYWHMVDVLWIVIFSLLYLLR